MDKPDWYLTPKEFVDIVLSVYIQVMERNYARSQEKMHPEDLAVPMQSIVDAVAWTLITVGKSNERA